nr:MAG TPA: hypothetical protein [Caudoviricetes sp.]
MVASAYYCVHKLCFKLCFDQIVIIINNALFLILNKNKVKYSFGYSALGVLFFFIFETAYNFIFETTIGFDAIGVNRDEKLKIFLLIIPLRIIEICSIFIYKKITENKK